MSHPICYNEGLIILLGGFFSVETRDVVTIDHSDLLLRHPNKYELVLKVARRAKQIKEEMARMPTGDSIKPIPAAILEMLNDENLDERPM